MDGPYKYQQLPPAGNTGQIAPYTRVLCLTPGTDDERLCGRLDIINPEQSPQYDALSYTWGLEGPSNHIWLDGNPLPIRPNLESALFALRLPGHERRLWIDAICIDQTDLDERSRQVRYMRHIYKNAARVFAWLGPKTPGTQDAIHTAKRVAEVREMVSQAQTESAHEPLDPDSVEDFVTAALQDVSQASMVNLVRFLDRDYFHRSWVVQEIIASSHAVAKVGGLEMPFFDLVSANLFLARFRQLAALPLSIGSFKFWYDISHRRSSSWSGTEANGSMGSLEEVLEDMRPFKATDIRDKIFSAVGISDEGLESVAHQAGSSRAVDLYAPAALTPDYRIDPVSVYTNVASYLITRAPGYLDVLSYVQHHDAPSASEYPSWVPKWFEAGLYPVFRKYCFEAGLRNHQLPDIPVPRMEARLRGSTALSLKGFHIAKVHKVSDTMIFSHGTDYTAVIGSTWSQLFSTPITHNPGRPYRTGEPLNVEFCLALMASPKGFMYASVLSQQGLGMPNLDGVTATDKRLIREAYRIVSNFLASLAHSPGAPSLNATDMDLLRPAIRWYSDHRRAYLTEEGYIGIGPPAMLPGDDVVVLFRGTMPYVLRRRREHFAFIGDCYVRDDEIMFGKMAERARQGRGGPAISTFELR